MSSTKDTSTFELKSSLQLSDFVEILLEPLYKYQHLYLIRLGLHEALVNAVKHGNQFDSSKIIKVKRIITPHWWVWIIMDQGQGIVNEKRKSIMGNTFVPIADEKYRKEQRKKWYPAGFQGNNDVEGHCNDVKKAKC